MVDGEEDMTKTEAMPLVPTGIERQAIDGSAQDAECGLCQLLGAGVPYRADAERLWREYVLTVPLPRDDEFQCDHVGIAVVIYRDPRDNDCLVCFEEWHNATWTTLDPEKQARWSCYSGDAREAVKQFLREALAVYLQAEGLSGWTIEDGTEFTEHGYYCCARKQS